MVSFVGVNANPIVLLVLCVRYLLALFRSTTHLHCYFVDIVHAFDVDVLIWTDSCVFVSSSMCCRASPL